MGNPNKLRRGLFLAATLAPLAVAALCLFYGGNNFVAQSVGMLAMFASLAVGRRLRTSPASPEVRAMQSAWTLKPWHWLVGLALIASVAATLAWLHWASTIPGYKGAEPVYAFAAAGLVCGGWWAGLIARWSSR